MGAADRAILWGLCRGCPASAGAHPSPPGKLPSGSLESASLQRVAGGPSGNARRGFVMDGDPMVGLAARVVPERVVLSHRLAWRGCPRAASWLLGSAADPIVTGPCRG